MKKAILLICLFGSLKIKAQDESVKRLKAESSRSIKKDESDTIPLLWRKGGLYNIAWHKDL